MTFERVDQFLAQAQSDLDRVLDAGTASHVGAVAVAWQGIEDARYELHLLKTAPVTKTETTHCCVPHEQPDGRRYVAELEARLAKAENVTVRVPTDVCYTGPWLRHDRAEAHRPPA